MSKFVAIFTEDESQAYATERALRTLHQENDLTLYAAAVIAKDDNGQISLKNVASNPLEGTTIGVLAGGLVGILGGAIAGPAVLAVGGLASMATGALAGSFWDLYNEGISTDFIDEVSHNMSNNKVAVLAEVDEYWETPLDTQVAALGGSVVRTWRSQFEDRRAQEIAEQNLREYEAAKAELAAATAETKARAQQKLEAAKAKLQESNDKIKRSWEKFESDSERKIHSIQTQINTAKAESKLALEKRLSELKADREVRSGKLKEAWQLTKSALS